jgi:hypothetical protein
VSLREVAEGHRTGEGDMNGMMCVPKLNSYETLTIESDYVNDYRETT